jgi:hypothetical protein
MAHEVKDIEVSTSNPGVTYRGQTRALERIIEGVDPALRRRKMVRDEAAGQLDLLRYDLIHPQTVEDAVDLATFLVDTAIEMQRFSDGTYLEPQEIPGCGGPVRVAVVTRAGARVVED